MRMRIPTKIVSGETLLKHFIVYNMYNKYQCYPENALKMGEDIMAKLVKSIVINAPVEKIFAYMNDPANLVGILSEYAAGKGCSDAAQWRGEF